MSQIDNAIARLQYLALSVDLVEPQAVRVAPDYPIENADVLPMSIAHAGAGEFSMASDFGRSFPNLYVDFHFNRANLKMAYRNIDALIYQYPAILAGDPTLNGQIDSIVFPVSWADPTVVQYDSIQTLMVRFTVPVKILQTPVTA